MSKLRIGLSKDIDFKLKKFPWFFNRKFEKQT